MHPDTALDPSVTAEEVEAAQDATPAPYAGDQYAHDDLEGLGAGPITPNTPAVALANAKRLTDDDVYVGVGYCLKTVRDPEFGVAALWPDAETAWEQAGGKHPTSNPDEIPRGAVVYWTNGRFGHVALSVGGGLCRTTDYRRPGYVDLARIDRLGSWCGGELVGWAEELNGVDVWPNPHRRHRDLFTIEDRIAVVRHALKVAQAHHAPAARVEGLDAWLTKLVERRDRQHHTPEK